LESALGSLPKGSFFGTAQYLDPLAWELGLAAL
jgi:hypothetical protein